MFYELDATCKIRKNIYTVIEEKMAFYCSNDFYYPEKSTVTIPQSLLIFHDIQCIHCLILSQVMYLSFDNFFLK